MFFYWSSGQQIKYVCSTETSDLVGKRKNLQSLVSYLRWGLGRGVDDLQQIHHPNLS